MSHQEQGDGPPLLGGRPRLGSGRLATRRAVTLLLMSVLLPGSAQLVAGDRRVGRVVLRVWLILVGLVLAFLLLALISLGTALSIFVRPWALLTLQAVLLVVGVGWLLVLVDAWRLGRPGSIRGGRRVGVGLLAALLVVTVSGTLLVGSRYAGTQRGLIGEVFAEGAEVEVSDGRINVLLLGGDAGENRTGLRPDSIILASTDVRTGATVLFSLPRNLVGAPFPEGTPLDEEFPTGFPDLLNAIYNIATANPSLVPDATDPGAVATMQAVQATLGIPVHYYVLVDMAGFREFIDALGGITVRVEERLPIGGGEGRPVTGYIEPGLQDLDGYEALWYARSRLGASDYARIARQRCVMGAVLRQASPQTALLRFQQIAASTTELISTNIPQDALPDLVSLVPEVRTAGVTSVQFVPPLIDSSDPDLELIRATVQEAIAASTESPAPAASPESTDEPDESGPTGTDDTGSGEGGDEGASADAPADPGESEEGSAPVELGQVCSYE